MSLWTPFLISVSLVGGVNDVSADQPNQIQLVSHTCAAPCQTVCPSTCDTCQPTCDSGCNPCHVIDPCNPCSWFKPYGLECYSTCNLYPHYAYYPKCHGYWHFQAYNWIHIDQHRLTLAGEDYKFPYSDKIFDQVYASFEPALGERDSDQLPLIRKGRLPVLEDLLK